MSEHPHERLHDAAARMTQLLDDPHPGLSTWNAMCEEAYQTLRSAVLAEDRRRGEETSDAKE